MKVAIIKYNAGNIRSVSFALDRLKVDHIITDDKEVIQSADKVIFPGVGEANTTMRFLREKNLDQLIVNLKQPVLGICLGMQLMCAFSEENNTSCLGIFDESVKLFDVSGLKVPHMGWNSLQNATGWLDESFNNEFVYFVHSYYVPLSRYTSAQCSYGVSFSAAMQKGNFYATQFHPEKSADVGEKILLRFLNISL